jgi:putative membrane-bound dehydrogenase-like protein
MMRKNPVLWGTVAGLLSALPAYAQISPEQTVESFKVAPGLKATAWASEPLMVNPTNMDIDERGRIWVTEAANYRRSVTREQGDRIMILEDTHHTGKCDSYKVFVQDKRLFAPLGICKLGNKLIVSQSPDVFIYTIDESGDHPVGEPQILFTGFGGNNHDHGVHAGVFGPDGRFYFNCGNEGGKGLVENAEHKPIIDLLGSEVGGKGKIYRGKEKVKGRFYPREGFAFSCNLDGSNFETYAYNFRNNYELCVDSFGTVWQSDNDDDGNQGVRINYIMEGGNFGYNGPKGQGWQRDKDLYPKQTHQEAQWHQRFPGVVPNMLHTGQGAPCGICVYEGDLLPEPFRNVLIHADAGPNVVRAYITQPSEHVARGIMNKDGDESSLEKPGAGFKCEPVDLIKSSDRWFRPDDVCIAPDGAVYVTDWSDPGVGGHATGDTGAKTHEWEKLHGRIFRLAPIGYKPAKVKVDLSTVEGQIAALESPNQSIRYLGYTKLTAGGEAAHKALTEVYTTSKNSRFRARALWLLARETDGKRAVETALKDSDSDIRVTAVRAARQIKMDMVKVAGEMLNDSSPAVLRELCLAMRFEADDRAIPVLVKLADKFDGTDRWYLEAFGIGATDREAEVLAAWEKDHQNKSALNNAGIAWRLKLEAVPMPEQPVASADSADHVVSASGIVLSGGGNSATVAPSAVVEQPMLSKDGRALPRMAELALLSGDAHAGEAVFRNANGANCIRCHQLGDTGGIIGPPLTVIGQKLSKPQLYEAILYPSAAIEMGYETWVVRTKGGDTFTGRKVEDTDDHVTILDADGKYHDIPVDQVDRKVQQKISIMPEGLSGAMTKTDIVNLVEFLASRK